MQTLYFDICKRKNSPLCDLCNERKATDVHHLINKFQVMTGPTRNKIDREELCVVLCRECHAIAPQPENAEKLWRIVDSRYGKETINCILEEIKEDAVIVIWRTD